jgi:ribosome-binding factor A
MAGAPTPRQQRVGDLLRAEISEIVRMRMRDPRLGFVTVTEVNVSRDLRHASVFVSVLGEESDGLAALAVLNRAAGFLRSELGGRVDLKHIPELRFKIDRSAEHAVRISSVLKKIMGGESGESP